MHHRPQFDEIFMQFAWMISKRSTCQRLQVGCVITSIDHRYVYAIGYNGNATGLTNCCDSNKPGQCQCIHAESNACINCTTDRSKPKLVYVTHLPCVMCAKSLINLGGVQSISYDQDYRIKDSLDVFKQTNIKAKQFNRGINENNPRNHR